MAQLAAHPAILDLAPDKLQRDDIELENKSAERMYVVVEPARIENPGTPQEQRVSPTDPEQLGLLASPPKLILEPGEHRFVRFAALAPPGDTDRIFRVVIKPVTGPVTAAETGLKVMVGYDALVIQRPAKPTVTLRWVDQGDKLTITNTGNTNTQLIDGKACPPGKDANACLPLLSQRLYAGNSITVAKPQGSEVTFGVLTMGKISIQHFR